MKATANSRLSTVARTLHADAPVLRAASLGDEAFIGFITEQAKSLAGAQLVLTSLEEQVQRGFRLDSILRDVLAIAHRTVQRSPKLAAMFH